MPIAQENLDVERLLATGKLFSEPYEDRERFAYHGTSAPYGDAIEQTGFQRAFTAAPLEDFLAVVASIPPGNEELAATLLRHAKNGPTRLGFYPLSYAAIDAALKDGGQILSKCRLAVKLGASVTTRLAKVLEATNESDGCVYAVDLSRFKPPDVAFEAYAFQSRVDIAADCIVARVVVPHGFDLSFLKPLQQKMPLFSCAEVEHSLAHRLKVL